MTFARIRALAIVGVLVVGAIVLVTMAIARDRPNTAVATCGPGDVPANIALPKDPTSISVNVFNAGGPDGAARGAAEQFKERKFQVKTVDNATGVKVENGIALLRYGPKAYGAAWLVKAYFLDSPVGSKVQDGFDIKRTDDTIDVIIGPGFEQLATYSEQRDALSQMTRPSPPPGTCDANKVKK
jgi:hypothetical protein